MNLAFKDYLLQITNASACHQLEIIESLWSGYGNIVRYQLVDSPLKTVVVKHISLNKASEHPRGWNSNYSHNRKVKSYKVETHWYQQWNQRCNDYCKTPTFIGSYNVGKDQWIVLEDLDHDFPVRKYNLALEKVHVCLQWLANFHGTFIKDKPSGLWEIGTYWHLETRPDEFEKIEHQALKAKAHVIDELLNQSNYQTIVHGDAKLANFCFSENEKQVAAVDFQYVGGGCGMKDVAYFLGSCLTSSECSMSQNDLLDVYFMELHKALKTNSINLDFVALEQEWRMLYPVACTDFTRFLLGWMPSHQKVNNYHLNMMNSVLASL